MCWTLHKTCQDFFIKSEGEAIFVYIPTILLFWTQNIPQSLNALETVSRQLPNWVQWFDKWGGGGVSKKCSIAKGAKTGCWSGATINDAARSNNRREKSFSLSSSFLLLASGGKKSPAYSVSACYGVSWIYVYCMWCNWSSVWITQFEHLKSRGAKGLQLEGALDF